MKIRERTRIEARGEEMERQTLLAERKRPSSLSGKRERTRIGGREGKSTYNDIIEKQRTSTLSKRSFTIIKRKNRPPGRHFFPTKIWECRRCPMKKVICSSEAYHLVY